MKPARALVIAVAAVAALAACSGQPNAKAVAIDMVESLGLPEAQQECMLAELDNYTSDQLEDIGNANENIDFAAEDPVAQGDEAFQKFVADLESCA